MPTNSSVRRKFKLNEIVVKSVDIFQAIAETKGISLVIEHNTQAVLMGNRDQWIQVLNNLIDNALKYTPEGGKVTVNLSTITTEISEPVTTMAQLTVRDTVSGLKKRIYQKSFRGSFVRTVPELDLRMYQAPAWA